MRTTLLSYFQDHLRAKLGVSRINRSTLYELVLISCVGLLPITWFRGLLINTSDFAFPLNRESNFLATLSLWDDRPSTGFSNALQLPNLLFGIFSVTMQYIGLSLLGYEQLLFYIWFAGSGLSAYVLSRVLDLGRIARISASLFYMLNPFSLILIWSIGQGMIIAEYAFLPLVVGLFLHGLVSGRGVRYCLGLQLLWFALGLFGPAANVQLMMVYWVTIVIIFTSYGIAKLVKQDFSGFLQTARFAGLSVLGFALLNLFWLLPTLLQLDQYFNIYAGLATTAFIPNLDVYIQNSVQMANALRLMGYWPFPSGGWQGGAYYSYSAPYSGIGMIIITFVPLLLIILGLRKLTARMLLLIPPYFAGLLLITGVNPPLGWLKEFIFVNFPLFQTTRNVMVTWGLLVAVCSAPLFGYGLELAYKRIDRWGRNLLRFFPAGGVAVFSIIFLVVGVLVFPFWTGAAIQSGHSNFTAVDYTFEVPNYYYQLSTFINSQPGDFRVLSLPLSPSGVGFYDWQHGYIGPDPTGWFSNQPVVASNNLSPMRTLLARGFAQEPLFPGSLADIMAMMNIKYIVVHGDAEWRLIRLYGSSFYDMSPSIIRDSLDAPGIKYIGDIGNLSIYENTVNMSHIYASVNPVIFKGSFENVREVLPLGLIGSNTTIITGVSDPTEPQFNIGAGLTQVLNMSTNKADFFIPQNSTAEVYINAVQSPSSEVLIDGLPLSLSGSQALNLIPLSNIAVWSADGCSCNHFSTTQNQTTWEVNLAGAGDRNISFDFQSFNLTGHNIQILMDGNGSGSKITFQLYDTNGNYVGWNREMNWNGTRLVDLPLNSIDYYSGYPNTNNFNASQAKLLAIYYYPKIQQSGYTTIAIRIIHPSLPSDSPWSTTGRLNLTEGWHTLQLPQGQSGAGNLVISSKPQTMINAAVPPSLTYEKVSPTEYRVNVTNASNPFYLVFSESFDRGWRLYGHELATFGLGSNPRVSENDHFLVNGFANGWYIDKTGTYTLTLYFYPQVIYQVSLVLTGASFLAMIIIVVGMPRPLIVLLSRRSKFDKRSQ